MSSARTFFTGFAPGWIKSKRSNGNQPPASCVANWQHSASGWPSAWVFCLKMLINNVCKSYAAMNNKRRFICVQSSYTPPGYSNATYNDLACLHAARTPDGLLRRMTAAITETIKSI